MLKMSRDLVRSFSKGNQLREEEHALCTELTAAMAEHKGSPHEAWDANWEKVYELAHAHMACVTAERA